MMKTWSMSGRFKNWRGVMLLTDEMDCPQKHRTRAAASRQTICTLRPARRLALMILRPFLVRMRPRKPALRARFL